FLHPVTLQTQTHLIMPALFLKSGGTGAVQHVNTRICPLCESCACRRFIQVDVRDYWRCEACEVTFLEPEQRPRAERELAEYQQHIADPPDDGYRGFLMRVAEPLLETLRPAQQGLDYGCGPGPALADLLRDAGHSVALYDPFFS